MSVNQLLTIIPVCVSLAGSGSATADDDRPHGMMPVPREIQWMSGYFAIDPDVAVIIEGQESKRVRLAVERLTRQILWETGIDLGARDPSTKPSRTIVIRCAGAGAPVQFVGEDESYTLIVDNDKADLSADNPLGIIRGTATMSQLVESRTGGFVLPSVSIRDAPRFPWRGLLLDPCRHWMPLDVIRRNLDGMASVKLNVLHWHLTEDQAFRIESRQFPALHEKGSKGRYYTQEEVRSIIAYARDRGIRVVPEFDMPGHTASWLVGLPDLAARPGPHALSDRWGVMEGCLDPSRESTFEFLDGFLGEMADLFPDAYMHIGGDEVEGTWWKTSKRIKAFMADQGHDDIHDLQAYFNKRVSAVIQAHDKKMIGWDEISHPDLPKTCVIQSWRGRETLIEAAGNGRKAILSNGYYLDHMRPASFHYGVDPCPEEAECASAVLGGEACMWSEYVSAETVDSRIWPRLAVIAERLWSPATVTNVNDMYRRMERLSRRLESSGLRHRSNYRPMLRRMAGDHAIEPLETLCDVLEPVKFYQRSAAGGYTTTTPLNRVVDAVRPESIAAREFKQRVARALRSQTPAAIIQQLTSTLERWRNIDPPLRAMIRDNHALAEISPVAHDLNQLTEIGLQALGWLERGTVATPDWTNRANAMLETAGNAKAEVEIAILPAVRMLVRAAGGFSQAIGPSFSRSGSRQLFTGVNFWQAMHMGQEGARGDRERLRAELDHLQSLGLTNVRLWASAEGPDSEPYRISPALTPQPGTYDTDVWTGLDFTIAELARRDMQAVVVLTNFWEWSGGMAQYVSWQEKSEIPYPARNDWREFAAYAARFYTSDACQAQYRKHIEQIIMKVNPITGRRYRDEPAVFAWELANEPRNYPQPWIDETAEFIKQLDPNHMVTTGSEGSIAGQFHQTHASPAIDYATVHIWPQNWGWFDPTDHSTRERALKETIDYLDKHLHMAATLNKPVVLEEFGIARDASDLHDYHDPAADVSFRNRMIRTLGERLTESARNGGPAAGVNVWVWAGRSRPGDRWIGDPPHEKPGWYSIYASDSSTLTLLQSLSQDLHNIARARSELKRQDP